MHRRDGGDAEELDDEVPVRYGVDRIGRRAVETKRLGGVVAVDGEGRAAQRGGAERRFVEARAAITDAPAVAANHLHIGQQMVAEGHRLGALEMGETGHDGAGMAFRGVDQGGLEFLDLGVESIERVAHPELEVGHHLVVARARGVELATGLADQIGQARLDVHVDVLERRLKGESAALDLPEDLIQALEDGIAVLAGDDPLARQHGAMGLRRRDIGGVKPAIEADGGVDLLHQAIEAAGEPPAPKCCRAAGFGFGPGPGRGA